MSTITAPVVESARTLPWGGASRSDARLLGLLCPSDAVRMWVRTSSRMDVGRWLLSARVRVAVLDDALVLIASGPRPVAQRLPFSSVCETFYNHVTGELVLAPAPLARVSSLRVTPDDAVRIIRFIRREAD